MGNYVHYRDKFKHNIRYCLDCRHVELLPDSTLTCPNCNMVGSLSFFTNTNHFVKHVEMYNPTMNVHGHELKALYNEVKGQLGS